MSPDIAKPEFKKAGWGELSPIFVLEVGRVLPCLWWALCWVTLNQSATPLHDLNY